MHHLIRSLSGRLPLLLTLLLPLMLLTAGCSRFNNDGSLAPWGILLFILDVLAIINIANKSWDAGKKIIWAAIVFFFPFGGLIIYYIFGRNS